MKALYLWQRWDKFAWKEPPQTQIQPLFSSHEQKQQRKAKRENLLQLQITSKPQSFAESERFRIGYFCL